MVAVLVGFGVEVAIVIVVSVSIWVWVVVVGGERVGGGGWGRDAWCAVSGTISVERS